MKRSEAIEMLDTYLICMQENNYKMTGKDLLEYIEEDMNMMPPEVTELGNCISTWEEE